MVWATPGYLDTLGIPLVRGRDIPLDRREDLAARGPRQPGLRAALPRRGQSLGPTRLRGPRAWQQSLGNRRRDRRRAHPRPRPGAYADDDRSAVAIPRAFAAPCRAGTNRRPVAAPFAAPRRGAGAGQGPGPLLAAAALARDRGIGGRAALPDDPAQPLRGRGAAPRRARHLRRDGLHRDAALVGDRHPHGAGRRRVGGPADGGEIGLKLALAGVALGLGLAFLGTRLLASLVYKVSITDPLTLAITAAVLIASALLASWVPARRATRVDPAISLRAE